MFDDESVYVMADPAELTFDEVIKFLKSKGGSTTNLELVSHFRKLLNDPLNQVEIRLRFKDIVNTVASVHEERGIKYISLKSKYFESPSCESESSASQYEKKCPDTSTSQTYQPYWRYRLSCNTKMVPPPPILSFRTGTVNQEESCRTKTSGNDSINKAMNLTEENPETVCISPHKRSSFDKRRAGVFDSEVALWLDTNQTDTPVEPFSVDTHMCAHQEMTKEDFTQNKGFDNFSKAAYQSDFHDKLINQCNVVGLPVAPEKNDVDSSSPLQSSDKQSTSGQDVDPSLKHSIHEEGLKDSGSSIRKHKGITDQKWNDLETSQFQQQPSRECGLIGAKVDSSPEDLGSAVSLESAEDTDEYQLRSGSVRERALEIEKMAALDSSSRRTSPRLIYRHAKSKEQRNEKISDDDSSVISTLDSKLRRQWFVKAAQSDYHGLLSLLKLEPRLAGIRDITSGFTALHWASKHGNAEIVKLLAGSHKVSPDIKSHGGYTCIHLATLYKHKGIVDLLLKTYGANPTIRDNSGKRADQYPPNYVRLTAGATRQAPAARHFSKDRHLLSASLDSLLVRESTRPKRRKTFRINFRRAKQRQDNGEGPHGNAGHRPLSLSASSEL